MSELDPDDYAERLKHPEQDHDILAAWLLMLLVASLFISLGSFLGGAHSMSFGASTPALVVTFVDPSDRIDRSDGAAIAPLSGSSVVGGDTPTVLWSAR